MALLKKGVFIPGAQGIEKLYKEMGFSFAEVIVQVENKETILAGENAGKFS